MRKRGNHDAGFRAGVGRLVTLHNLQRPHVAHGGHPPAAVAYFNTIKTDPQVQVAA